MGALASPGRRNDSRWAMYDVPTGVLVANIVVHELLHNLVPTVERRRVEWLAVGLDGCFG